MTRNMQQVKQNSAVIQVHATPLAFHKQLTGSGSDQVDIQIGIDQRVYIKVNDKEVWCGTQEQFQNLVLGNGDDLVTNTVAEARIATGNGWNTVLNLVPSSSIDPDCNNDENFKKNRN